MNRTLTFIIGAALATNAVAATAVIGQRFRVFSEETISIKRGVGFTFFNNDNVPHNIFSTSKGNEFDLGSQPPGASTDVTFNTLGDVQVFCAIHPRMKMTVRVTD